jgi:acetylornithine aminotransferase
LTPGRHGSTFGGNPLACRTACTVLDVMQEEGLSARAEQLGHTMLAAFRERLGQHPAVVAIRGRGLMIGIELDREADHLKELALQQNLLLNVTQHKVIRLLPPLIIDAEQAEEIVAKVCGLVEGLEQKPPQ